MSAGARQKESAERQTQEATKADGDVGFNFNVVTKLSQAWGKYVKGLFGDQPGEKKEAPAPKKPEPKVPVSADPKATTVHDGKNHEPQYADVGTEVFKDGPQMEDVKQGYLADCYLVAAMAAIAKQRPDLIQKMIADHGDGTATVTLYETQWGLAPPGEGKAVPVRISLKMPSMDGKKPTYAKSSTQELWPSLIEKAYVVQEKGGDYQNANKGGDAGAAMQKMLGKPSTSFSTSSRKPADILTELEQMIGGGKPVVAGSFGKDEAKTNAALKKLADEKVVYAWHAYVVVSVDAKGNKITLYNPWGQDHPETLTAEEFQKLYRNVYVGNPTPPQKEAA